MRFQYLFLLIYFFFQTSYACDLIDDEGNQLHLQKPATRIVSLAPNLTEILFSIHAGKNIVGVMRGSDYPDETKKIPIVANYNNMDAEAILALHPDLIVIWSDTHSPQTLKKFNIPIYMSHQKNIVDIAHTMRQLGCLTGNEKIAEKVAVDFLTRYQKIKIANQNKKPITVFYQVWPNPLMTITKNSWINEIILLCGGKNIFENLHGAAPEISFESVLTAHPNVIIGAQIENWHSWPRLHAYSIQTDLIERPGPRVLSGAEEVCRVFDKERIVVMQPSS